MSQEFYPQRVTLAAISAHVNLLAYYGDMSFLFMQSRAPAGVTSINFLVKRGVCVP